MSQLLQDDNGDIAIGKNKMSLVSGDDEIEQRVVQNLRTFFTEWFLDQTIGVPWFQIIFEKGVPDVLKEDTIKQEILKVDGVAQLTRFDPIDFDGATRVANLSFEVLTVNQQRINIEGEFP